MTTAPHQPVLPHTGTRTITRPATLDDFNAVNALHDRCSLATRFARYQAARRSLRLAEFHHLTRPTAASPGSPTLRMIRSRSSRPPAWSARPSLAPPNSAS
ncbi:hypothetical protein ACFV4X_12955 [Streptomyces ardesiacus]|uniref:hypothetical protein n=1 Tax=Streptomyces ardesiacus TaxID=285564 RepID=UPI003661A84C